MRKSLYTKIFGGFILWSLIMLNAYGDRPEDIPEKLSILLEQKDIISGTTGEGYDCKLRFEGSYGLKNDKDFNYLIRLIHYAVWIDVDIDCHTNVHLDALQHLLDLSTIKKSSKASKTMLLNYSELALDGELAEIYVDTYMIKVLLGLDNVSEILDTKDKLKQVSEDLCNAWSNPMVELDLVPLVEKLHNKKFSGELISSIENTCPKAFPK